MEQFVVTIIVALSLGGTYSLIALGLIIIYRGTDTFNFAHGEFMLLAAYLVAEWQGKWHAPLLVVMIASLVVVAFAGWFLFRIVLRRVIGKPIFIGVVATLGVAAMMDGIMGLIFGSGDYQVSSTWLPTGSVTILTARVGVAPVIVAAISLAIAALVAVVVRKTPSGARLRASGQDVLLASQSGINVQRVNGASWAIGCALAGVAGIAYAQTNFVAPTMTSLGLLAFPAIILGGMDSIEGSIFGGIIIGAAQSFTASYWGGQWVEVSSYTILLLVVLLMPNGLFGTRTVVRV